MPVYDKILSSFASSPMGSWLVLNVASPLDRHLLRWSKARFNLSAGTGLGHRTVLVIAKGAKSGKERQVALLMTEYRGQIGLIASKAGATKAPAWYHNLKANPECRVLIRGEEIACVAREVDGDTRQAVWDEALTFYPGYDEYAERAGRKIPVLVLEPVAGQIPPIPQPILPDIGLLLMRVSLGAMMLFSHGLGKIDRLSADPIQFADPIGVGPAASLWLAVFAEVVCAVLVAVGALTRFAAVPLLITMLVAAFIVHGDDPFKKQEFALLYAVPFLALIFTGPGRLSVDHFLFGRR